MKNYLQSLGKKELFIKFFFVLLVLFATTGSDALSQVRSDLEIKQGFEQRVDQIRASVTGILRTNDADSLLNAINDIELDYEEHKVFLNQVLEPQTFDQMLGDLRNLIAIQRSQLETIDAQREEIVVLNQRITGFTELLLASTLQTDSLRSVISRTNASREVMSNLVRDYRSRLDDRDILIRSFIDSLVVTFDDPMLRNMMNSEQAVRVNRLNNNDDVLKLIQSIIDDNIAIISGATEFDAPFYLKMNSLQTRIDDMWSKLGITIATVYQGRQNAQKVDVAVKDRISTWRQRLHGAMWNSMYRSFSDNGILLDDFDSQTGFVSSVNAYLDTTLVRLHTGVSETDYKNYEAFKQFWTTEVKSEWAPLMLETKLLNMEDINTIDQKVEDWGSISRPRSDNLYIYLGISLVIIIAMAVMLIVAKRNANKMRSQNEISSANV